MIRPSIWRYIPGFVVGLGIIVWPLCGFQGSGNPEHSSSQSATKENDFTWILAGEGMLEGAHTDMEVYRARDGEKVELVRASFGSTEAAKRAHEHLRNRATQVIKYEAISDRTGNVIGERSILTMPEMDHKASTAIVITKGSKFTEIVSFSSQDAASFEKSIEND